MTTAALDLPPYAVFLPVTQVVEGRLRTLIYNETKDSGSNCSRAGPFKSTKRSEERLKMSKLLCLTPLSCSKITVNQDLLGVIA